MANPAPTTFGLPEVLSALWSVLETAGADLQTRSRRKELVIDSASVEIAFTVASAGTDGGGLSIQVLGARPHIKGGKSRTSELVHRLTVHLAATEPTQSVAAGSSASNTSNGKKTTARKSTPRKTAARGSTAVKTPARASTARTTTARKTTARKTAAGRGRAR